MNIYIAPLRDLEALPSPVSAITSKQYIVFGCFWKGGRGGWGALSELHFFQFI